MEVGISEINTLKLLNHFNKSYFNTFLKTRRF